MKPILALTLLMIMFSSCSSVQKMMDQGRYDDAIHNSVKKLTGKAKKEKYVRILEDAFQKANTRDMRGIEMNQVTNTAESWKQIISLTSRIQSRQDKIEPLLPLESQDGYRAKFSFVKLEQIRKDAVSTAVALYMDRMFELADAARNGDKGAAQEAHILIDQIKTLDHTINNNSLQQEMRELGTNHILVEVDNQSRALLPAGWAEEILASDLYAKDKTWERFYNSNSARSKFDYVATIVILDVLTSREEFRERSQDYTKEIVDGWEYVLDSRGNVLKDSLGNDVKRDKYVKVNATVVEYLQEKRSLIRSRLDVTSFNKQNKLISRPIEYEQRFEHIARNVYGDERALESKLRGTVQRVPYPSDSEMLWGALRGLKPLVYDEIRKVRYTR